MWISHCGSSPAPIDRLLEKSYQEYMASISPEDLQPNPLFKEIETKQDVDDLISLFEETYGEEEYSMDILQRVVLTLRL